MQILDRITNEILSPNAILREYLGITEEELQALYRKAQRLEKYDQKIKLTEKSDFHCGGCLLNPSKAFEDSLLEKHHIVPRSLGGTDKAENLVNLCPTCHVLAHIAIRLGRMTFWNKAETCEQIRKIKSTLVRNRFGKKNR